VAGPAEVAALADDINGLISSVGHELRERQRAEESARSSERNYRVLFESTPLPMCIYDAETLAILEVNDAAVSQLGHSREEFQALSIADLVVPREHPRLAELLGEVESVEPRQPIHLRKNGAEIEVQIRSHPVTFADRPARFVLMEDVTERERLERQLREAQRMEAIGRLAGGVSHDFNNLLTAIIGYSDLMLKKMPPQDSRREDAEQIKKAGKRAAVLTRQLLAFSRGQVLAPVVFDLNAVVRDLEPMLRRVIREDIRLSTQLLPASGRVRADRGQIEQVIVNLVVNAADAMPEGGIVTTERVYLDAEDLHLHPASQGKPGDYVLLEVTDTGIGMDEETISHIFEPFYTTKKGTGLGLATVYGIV
jgi:two-component system cell cycle sensor histidine kinase/response regulator CckA